MRTTYPQQSIYFDPEQGPFVLKLESIARKRGISFSLLVRRCLEGCEPILDAKSNQDKMHLEGKIKLNLVKNIRA